MEDLEQGAAQTGRGKLQYSLEYNFRAQEVGMLAAVAQQGKVFALAWSSLCCPLRWTIPSCTFLPASSLPAPMPA